MTVAVKRRGDVRSEKATARESIANVNRAAGVMQMFDP